MILLLVLTALIVIDGVTPGDPVSMLLLGLAVIELIAEIQSFA